MKVTKVEKGDYIIVDNTSVYEVYQSSVSKKWFLYKGEFIGGIFYVCNKLRILEIMWYNK